MALPLIPTMALGRIAAGALSWANPELAAKTFGLKGEPSAYTSRLFGSRDIALGLLTLSPNRAVRRNTLKVALLVDALDCAAGVQETKAGKTTPVGTGVLVGGAAAFVVMGFLALRDGD